MPEEESFNRINFQLGDGAFLTLSTPQGYAAREGGHTVLMATEQFAGALATLVAKNKNYAGAWREQGWMGNLARIMSKTARLRQMLWREVPHDNVNESVGDTLQDLLNLCVFALLNINGGNRWGRTDA